MTYTWPDVLTGLVRREGLEAEAAQWALSEILAGRASVAQGQPPAAGMPDRSVPGRRRPGAMTSPAPMAQL